MNDERNGFWLWQTDDIRGHMWHGYSVTVNKVTVATVKCSKRWLQLNYKGLWISSRNPLIKEIKLWNIGSTERYILHMHVALEYYQNSRRLYKIKIAGKRYLYLGHNIYEAGNQFVRCCIYLTTYDWIKSFLKITIERRAIYGNLENKINALYLARRKFHS